MYKAAALFFLFRGTFIIPYRCLSLQTAFGRENTGDFLSIHFLPLSIIGRSHVSFVFLAYAPSSIFSSPALHLLFISALQRINKKTDSKAVGFFRRIIPDQFLRITACPLPLLEECCEELRCVRFHWKVPVCPQSGAL